MRRMMISTTATRATSSARMMRTVRAPSAEVNRQRLGRRARVRYTRGCSWVRCRNARARAEPSRRRRRTPWPRDDGETRRADVSGRHLAITRVLVRARCAIVLPHNTEVGAGTMNRRRFYARWDRTVERVLSGTVGASGRFEVRGEPESGAKAYSVSSHPETGAGERAGDVFGIARGVGHRHRGARRRFVVRQLGIPGARVVGSRVGGVDGRHGGDAIYVFSTVRVAESGADGCGDSRTVSSAFSWHCKASITSRTLHTTIA